MFATFEKNIGIKEETLKFWPGRDEAKLLLKKIERAAPGLTKFKDPKSNSIKDFEICEAVCRRFDYDITSMQPKVFALIGEILC